MKQLVTINLTTRTTDWQPPVLTFGESLTLALRFQKTVDGNAVEPLLAFDSARAAIGNVDARPGGGSFALQFGADPSTSDNTTDAVPHDCSPAALSAAINAKAAVVGLYGTCTAKKLDGSWLLRFGSGSVEVPLKVVDNSLWPVTFGRISAWQVDALWVHELRLWQAPVAFTTASGDDVLLPPAPTISTVRAGGETAGVPFNELQQLYIPPEFRGAYVIKKGYARTALLSPDASADEIQAELEAAFGTGNFAVTLPTSYHFLIEFTGDFAGTDMDQLEIDVEQAPAGDLNLTLPLDRRELAAMLRREASVTLPLEVRIVVREDGSDDPYEIVALYVPVTIQRPLSFPELDETPVIDWLRFPSPRSYVPFGADNILTGEKVYAHTQGDGIGTSFTLAHGLASEDVRVFVRENMSGGRQLIDGTDFTVIIDDANQVIVTALEGAPGVEAWRVMVVAAKEIASWAEGLTVTIAQVEGLEDALEGFDSRLKILETLLPAAASLANGGLAPVDGIEIELPETSEILFARDGAGVAITDPALLPARAPYLLPAIDRTDNDGALSDPIDAPEAGALYTTAAATLIPGGGHIRSSYSTASGFVGSDGRINYPVSRSGTSDSYFPTPFERTLFEMAINENMFSSGTKLTLLFKLALQLIRADTEAQWVVAIEQGAFTADVGSPSNTFDANLASVTWNTASPLLSQRLILSSALQTHGFGCVIANSAGTFTANALYYKRVVAANDRVPASANFALRARLLNFDTKNSVTTAKGWLSWALQTPDNGGTLGAVIA